MRLRRRKLNMKWLSRIWLKDDELPWLDKIKFNVLLLFSIHHLSSQWKGKLLILHLGPDLQSTAILLLLTVVDFAMKWYLLAWIIKKTQWTIGITAQKEIMNMRHEKLHDACRRLYVKYVLSTIELKRDIVIVSDNKSRNSHKRFASFRPGDFR